MQVTTIHKISNATYVGDVVSKEEALNLIAPTAADLNENTFTNYEYTKTYGNPNTWELRRPDGSLTGTIYFKTYEVTQNKSYISTFKSSVDTINSKEGEIVLALGFAGLADLAAAAISAGALVTGGALTPAAWTSILAAAGANTAYLAVVRSWDNACKSAYDAYWDTYTKSPNIFF